MFSPSNRERIQSTLHEIDAGGFTKRERILQSPQSPHIQVPGREDVLNLCANNYLGLANDSDAIAAAKEALDTWGYGMASVRFICGTQSVHRDLERRLSEHLGMEDTILYSSCFDANGGLFETLLGPEDAVISDALNHASIIDGIRLCKAERYRFANREMKELEARLNEAKDKGARTILIVTDGVFSMDGHIADLRGICDLADKFEALVMVDDSHATGFFGPGGKGTPTYCDVADRVDIITSTLGKALGGATGGFTSARQEIVDLLRQRSRPYLFSNSIAPPVAAASLRVLDIVQSSKGKGLRHKLVANTTLFRELITEAGFEIIPGEHPIVPIMIGDAAEASKMADELLKLGIYVIAFSYPVVPQGQARIRVQVSAAHSEDDLRFAAECFRKLRG